MRGLEAAGTALRLCCWKTLFRAVFWKRDEEEAADGREVGFGLATETAIVQEWRRLGDQKEDGQSSNDWLMDGD